MGIRQPHLTGSGGRPGCRRGPWPAWVPPVPTERDGMHVLKRHCHISFQLLGTTLLARLQTAPLYKPAPNRRHRDSLSTPTPNRQHAAFLHNCTQGQAQAPGRLAARGCTQAHLLEDLARHADGAAVAGPLHARHSRVHLRLCASACVCLCVCLCVCWGRYLCVVAGITEAHMRIV